MRCSTLILVLGITLASAADDTRADHRSYPKVRTFSGGYYGPTQAHYQYQRRYGRPWHGQGGFRGGIGTGYVNGYPGGGFYSRGSWNWPTFGLGTFPVVSPFLGGYGYSYTSYFGGSTVFPLGYGAPLYSAAPYAGCPLPGPVFEPRLSLQSPGIYTPFWSGNPAVNDGLLHNGYLWQQETPDLIVPQVEPLNVEPLGNNDVPLPATSSPQAQLRSLQHQQRGDARLRELDYLQAYLRYKEATEAAEDRAEPHYRMGIALAGMKRFDKAVRELKRATQLDPSWVNSVSLDELLGDDNRIGKTQLKQRAADWALGDAYDADRLYLLGTLLHLDGDPERARILLDTAVALVGSEQHLTAFSTERPALEPEDEPGTAIEDAAPDGELPGPPPEVNPTLPSLRAPAGPVFPTRLSGS